MISSVEVIWRRPTHVTIGVSAVFIDGGYLDKVMYHDFRNQRVDMAKLAHEMASPDELLRAYYYHCLPYQSNPPTKNLVLTFIPICKTINSLHAFCAALSTVAA